MRVVVLLGAPGAGKGTQAPILADRLHLPHVATGDLFRAAVRDGSPVGVEARRYMERGQLVPDTITVKMLLERLAQPDAADGVILDGFPRNRAQAVSLDEALTERGAVGRPGHQHRRAARGARRAHVRPLGVHGVGARLQRADQSAARDRPLRPGRLRADPARGRQGRDHPGPPGPDPGQPGRGQRPLPGPGHPAQRRRPPVHRGGDQRPRDRPVRCGQPGRRTPDHGHPQVARRDRRHAPGRAGRGRGPGPRRVRAQAGRLDRPPGPPGRGPHPQVRRDLVVQGLPGHQPAPAVPGQPVHLARRRDRPRHPGRADHPRGPGRERRRGRHRRRLAWRRRAHLLRRRTAGRRSATSSTRPTPR